MPTHASERPGLGEAARGAAEHASALARLEVQLALAEIKRKLVALGLGIGLVLGAALLALFGLGFAFATAAAAIATVLPTWAALLIVTGALLGGAGTLVALGLAAIKRGSPPVPELAIEEAKRTTQALRSNGSH